MIISNALSLPVDLVRRGAHWARCLIALLMMSGCVTEQHGGMPEPAPNAERVQAQLDLARGYLEQRELERAKPPLARALEIDPRHVEALVLNAVLMNMQGEYKLAEQYYRAALRVEPDNAQALNNYGSFLYSRGRFTDALVPLQKLVKDTDYRGRSQAFENLGLAQLQVNDKQAAQESFRRALDLNFRQARASLELAQLAYEQGRYKEAAGRLLEYRTMARQNARSLCLGVKVGTVLGDSDQVASNLLALKNLFPEQADQCQTNP